MFNTFYHLFEQVKEKRITKRRIPFSLWYTLLDDWKKTEKITIKELGKSYLGEPIHEIKWGCGPIKIAAWSQMHGDEATATMALCDLYAFLTKNREENQEIWKKLHQNITFYCIPYLNKDGAKNWQRETALGIDMNRDARYNYSPEAKILSSWLDEIQPEYAFNLHDQNRLYSAGNTPFQTQIALLATATDEPGTWTKSRVKAGKLANHLTKQLKPHLGPHLAKWNDEFEPRAFGDTIQQKGYGLILFEAGGLQWDLEKQYLRKITFCMLLDSLYQIANSSLENELLTDYQSLPTNEKSIGDIKITEAPLDKTGKLRADLLFNIKEIPTEDNDIQFTWKLEDIGDLSHIHGLTEINGSNLSHKEDIFLKKEQEYNEFILYNEDQIAFKLSTYTQKINQ